MRKPRDLNFLEGVFNATINTVWRDAKLQIHGVFFWLGPSEARRLANWLLRYADWATEKRKEGAS